MEEFDLDQDFIDEIVNSRINKIKNDIYLSDKQMDILKRYNINCYKFNNLSSLIFEIETLLNSGIGEEDLEQLSMDLSQINYYNNTNK